MFVHVRHHLFNRYMQDCCMQMHGQQLEEEKIPLQNLLWKSALQTNIMDFFDVERTRAMCFEKESIPLVGHTTKTKISTVVQLGH